MCSRKGWPHLDVSYGSWTQFSCERDWRGYAFEHPTEILEPTYMSHSAPLSKMAVAPATRPKSQTRAPSHPCSRARAAQIAGT